MTDRPAVLVQSRADLRAWLSLDHAAGQPVWLIRHKPPHPNQLQHDEMVAELIGWGWVDSQPKSIDDARCANLIAPPRNPKSAWSQVNKAPATQSRVTHLMTRLATPPSPARKPTECGIS